MPRAPKTGIAEPASWVHLPMELYIATAKSLVHFSGKTANSNIPPVGVRLGPEQSLTLPYLSARTLMDVGIPLALDYVANSGKTATAVKQLHQVVEGRAAGPANEVSQLKTLLDEIAQTRSEVGAKAVSLRSRQLLLPRREGDYVAVTPLSCGGISRLVRKRVRAHEDVRRNHPDGDKSGLQRLPCAVFGLGGANPQNVGSLVRDMQRPLVFFPPSESRQVKAALALYFNGASLRLPRPLLRTFRDWCVARRIRNDGRIPTDMHTRDEEIEHIRQITQTVLRYGETARQLLLAHRDVLPGGGIPLVSPEADGRARGLIDPELRSRDWPRKFAEQLARRLADHRFRDDRGEFQFDQNDRNALQTMIEEIAR